MCVGGYCPAHLHLKDAAAKRYEASRPNAAQRLYGPKWKRARVEFIAENPLCCDPDQLHVGRLEPTYQVDHIKAHKGDPKLFWNRRNWQPLCQTCGAHKSAVEAGGRAYSEAKQLQSMGGGIGDDGRIQSVPHKNRA